MVGIEPTLPVLETGVLPLNDAPVTDGYSSKPRLAKRDSLLCLLVCSVLTAPRAMLAPLHALLYRLLIALGLVVHPLALGAFELN